MHLLYPLIESLKQKREPRNTLANNNPIDSGYIYNIHGSFFIMTPEFIKHKDGLNPHTFLYCEELILAEEMRALNLKSFIIGEIEVVHKESKTTDLITRNQKEKTAFSLKHLLKSCSYFAQVLSWK
ncbi:MAG: hypothetical protein JXK05_05285 [Campylobacterales bacterium]|nr:hypothetical protein [Campylobacterales bacterium]